MKCRVLREVIDRAMDGPRWANSGRVVGGGPGSDRFQLPILPEMPPRLVNLPGLSRRPEFRRIQSEGVEYFLPDQLFPRPMRGLFQHRSRNGIAGIRIKILGSGRDCGTVRGYASKQKKPLLGW